ncbi:basic helix-loop-helix and HMG box domain-containing protein 1 isoform X2 [Sarcophilus harrisii]|uniref:basic helix-loop-helix and HMG box domain-containing protein 1 isoform X2 n=1 Tax=Sarcophilus harrisii TaxID=9305 RepID=UPI001301A830|nr:basic helix-loop-helix and HMG box domain-containing protein 1 isoform X2 [Sarcophilus harrisii]
MWGPSGPPFPPERPQGGPGCRMSPVGSSDRKRRRNHTNTLQELAMLLPIPLQSSSKKLTKEILLHVLHYIEHLQRSIDMAKSLLLFQPTDKEDRRAHLCLPLGRSPSQPGKQPLEESAPNRSRGAAVGGVALVRRHPTPCHHLESWLPPSHGGAELTLLEMAEGGVHFCLATCCGEASVQEEHPCPPCETPKAAGDEYLPPQPWSKPLPRQELVFYDSCEEEEEAAVDTGPWLSAWPPEGSPLGSPLVDSPRKRSWPGSGQPGEELGLSPSLFTSPGRLLPEKLLQEGAESLTQALFEDVCLSPQSSTCLDGLAGTPQKKDPAPADPPHSLDLFQSAFSLDHCYLSLSETSKTDSSPSSGVTELVSLWNRRQEASQPTPDGFLSSSDEDSDCTWTPTKRALPLPTFGRKRKRSRASGNSSSTSGSGRHKETKKAHCPFQLKKKCVNGFIMFCRLNRKQYIRACPGTASTAATKELAHLWRVMTKQERRPYCIKARKFSRQHNRIVRQDCSSEEDDRLSPKPFHLLLAEKALCCPGLACMGSPLGDPLPDSLQSV